MTRILIAVDGSETALEAVRHGIRLVRAGLDATVVLAHVQEEASLFELATNDSDAIAQASLEAGAHLMAPAVRLLEQAGVEFETEVGLGAPAATLVDLAENHNCDQLLIGSSGLGGLRRALMGSVSQAVLDLCPLPVTVVKPRPEDDLALRSEDGLAEAEMQAPAPPL